MSTNSKQVSRVYRALEAASNSAKDNQTRNMIEDITIHTQGYAEPGYEGEVIAIGDWNDTTEYNHITKERVLVSKIPSRLARVLGKLGVDVEWCDEWVECYDCGKLIRTQPDSMWWEPSFTCDDNSAHCLLCTHKLTPEY
jgi:hypothetical protein